MLLGDCDGVAARGEGLRGDALREEGLEADDLADDELVAVLLADARDDVVLPVALVGLVTLPGGLRRGDPVGVGLDAEVVCERGRGDEVFGAGESEGVAGAGLSRGVFSLPTRVLRSTRR